MSFSHDEICAMIHAKVAEETPGPSFVKLGGRKENGCLLLFPLRFVRCKPEAVWSRLLMPVLHFLLFHFFCWKILINNGVSLLVLFCCGWRVQSRGVLCPELQVPQRCVRFCFWAASCSIKWVQTDDVEAC